MRHNANPLSFSRVNARIATATISSSSSSSSSTKPNAFSTESNSAFTGCGRFVWQSLQHSSESEFWQLHEGGRRQCGNMVIEELSGGWRPMVNLVVVGNGCGGGGRR
ncbi:hypothetical protein PIB30_045069 [Stylosanthes scabra]|uniref:Uncharacterized protein n=1 Tax=Stylosanthes scabra TaxID=79078 RepID=A0ABU6VI87_9FABA|nr:hypothetical protein [Stylosanthes scabra]